MGSPKTFLNVSLTGFLAGLSALLTRSTDLPEVNVVDNVVDGVNVDPDVLSRSCDFDLLLLLDE